MASMVGSCAQPGHQPGEIGRRHHHDVVGISVPLPPEMLGEINACWFQLRS